MAKAFIDTNVFFYAVDARDLTRQKKARDLISDLSSAGNGVVSAQVIQEFANNVTKKLGFSPDETNELCEAFADHEVIKPDLALVTNALRLMRAASLSFWDACILSAAQHSHSKTLYTEDLNPGQHIGGVHIVDPFI